MPLSCKRGIRFPRLILALDFSLRGVPVFFEICNQCRAKMAIRLLTAIDRHVAAESVEWFFADTESAPIAGCTNHARAGEIVDYPCDGFLHLVRGHDKIADHAPFGAVAREATAHH